MAGTVRIAINHQDFELLRRRLDRLPGYVQSRIAKSALLKSATPFVRAIRANVLGKTKTAQRRKGKDFGSLPGSFTGHLKASITRVARRYGSFVLIVVGPKWPLGAHGHLVEFGTAGQRPHPLTRTSGQMTKHPFMWPAFMQTKAIMERTRNQELGRGIEKAATAA